MTRSSVVVVSHRPGEWLAASLRSVIGHADEVVVVDNGSAGGEAGTIARAAGARSVSCGRNLGFAGGVAAGLAVARGDLIGVLNDDAEAGETWLSSAAAVLEDERVGAVTPKVLLRGLFAEVTLVDDVWFAPGDARPLGRQIRSVTVRGREVLPLAVGPGVHELEIAPDGSDRWRWTAGARPWYVPVGEPGNGVHIEVDGHPVQHGPLVRVLNHAGSYLRGHGVAGEYGFGAPDDGRFDDPAERFGFSGTAPVFRSETLRRLGAFAPQFFAYNEDTDWCLRARLAGMCVRYDPHAVVTHRLSATSGGTSSVLVRRLAQRNALLCLVRNAPSDVARRHVYDRLGRGPLDPVARALVARLPWAVSTRVRMSRGWTSGPAEIWGRWAERDATWDISPARRPAGRSPHPPA